MTTLVDTRPGGSTTPAPPQPPSAGFELDLSLLELSDPAGQINLTDDGCGSTCGACTSNVA